MSDRVLIPLAGIGVLALDRETYESALMAGRQPTEGIPEATEALVDAETLAGLLSLPQSWIEQRTREGELPCYRAGRWIRYRRSEVELTLKNAPKGKPV